MIIQEDYVTFEQLKRLKEKGFPIHKCGYSDGWTKQYWDDENMCYYDVPTLSLVQKWLRGEKNIIVSTGIQEYDGINGNNSYGYWIWYFDGEHNQCLFEENFKSLENALLTGINKALKLI